MAAHRGATVPNLKTTGIDNKWIKNENKTQDKQGKSSLSRNDIVNKVIQAAQLLHSTEGGSRGIFGGVKKPNGCGDKGPPEPLRPALLWLEMLSATVHLSIQDTVRVRGEIFNNGLQLFQGAKLFELTQSPCMLLLKCYTFKICHGSTNSSLHFWEISSNMCSRIWS